MKLPKPNTSSLACSVAQPTPSALRQGQPADAKPVLACKFGRANVLMPTSLQARVNVPVHLGAIQPLLRLASGCLLGWLSWWLAICTAPGNTPDAPSQPTLTRKPQPNEKREAAAGSRKATYTLPKRPGARMRQQVPSKQAMLGRHGRRQLLTASTCLAAIASTACHAAYPANPFGAAVRFTAPPLFSAAPIRPCSFHRPGPACLVQHEQGTGPANLPLARHLGRALGRHRWSRRQCHNTPPRVHGEPPHDHSTMQRQCTTLSRCK